MVFIPEERVIAPDVAPDETVAPLFTVIVDPVKLCVGVTVIEVVELLSATE